MLWCLASQVLAILFWMDAQKERRIAAHELTRAERYHRSAAKYEEHAYRMHFEASKARDDMARMLAGGPYRTAAKAPEEPS